MKAMILAAGLGTRLRPLTQDRPKALVEIDGRTLLEITLSRLRSFGIRDVIINVHYFADMIVDYLRANQNFGMTLEISREEILLDTGGGLKKAGPFFAENSLPDCTSSLEPFVVHNVDVLSTIDLQSMLQFHKQHQALVTLAVQDRQTTRYLLFDGRSFELCGRQTGTAPPEMVRSAASSIGAPPHPLAFCGVQVISPSMFGKMTEEGVFPIVSSYLRLAAEGERIIAFRADEYYWRDIGSPESVAQATRDMQNNLTHPQASAD
jgi:NDP-sugar pyrophosphorylase family protein